MERPSINRKMKEIATVALLTCLFACTSDSAQSRFVLAERLWGEGNYLAATNEFDRIHSNDPTGVMGQRALYRSALTHLLYLEKPTEALEKFSLFLKYNSDPARSWEARKWMGEILFVRLERFDQAIQHYRRMVEDRPAAVEKNEFQYRIAKSFFRLWRFEEALGEFQSLSEKRPMDAWTRKAAYEIGNVYVTAGEQRLGDGGAYRQAIQAFKDFVDRHPTAPEAPEALLGMALAYEELDQLELAIETLEKARSGYPVPQVIDIKLARIQKRQSKKLR